VARRRGAEIPAIRQPERQGEIPHHKLSIVPGARGRPKIIHRYVELQTLAAVRALGETIQPWAEGLFAQGEQARIPASDAQRGQLLPGLLGPSSLQQDQRPVQGMPVLPRLPGSQKFVCGQGTQDQVVGSVKVGSEGSGTS
jgi:hypothetical protein